MDNVNMDAMARLIDAEALYEQIKEADIPESFVGEHGDYDLVHAVFDSALECVEIAPTVPEGVRRGFWKQDDTWKDLYFCSACIGRDHRNNPKYKYCPDCGARMDERERSE